MEMVTPLMEVPQLEATLQHSTVASGAKTDAQNAFSATVLHGNSALIAIAVARQGSLVGVLLKTVKVS